MAETPLSEVGLAQAERVAQRIARRWSAAAVLAAPALFGNTPRRPVDAS